MATADLSTRRSTPPRRAPSPPAAGLFGHLAGLRADPLGFLIGARAGCGDVVRFRLGAVVAHLCAHPDHFHHVLQKQQPIYDKDLQPLRRLRPVLGNGMVTADGADWQRQREVARPAFRQREIRSFGPAITASAADLAHRWRLAARAGAPLDIHLEMMQVTLRVAGRALFGVDLADQAAPSSDLLNMTMAAGLKRMNALIAAPMILPTPNNLRLRRARRSLVRLIDRIIDQRRAAGHGGEDLFARLLRDHGGTDGAQRSAQFYDEAITLLLAGHETTANALAFACHLLGRHPRIMGDLRAEARSVLRGRAAAIGDLAALAYTRMVLDEAMRLYPPAWIIDRNCALDDEIGGFAVPKGSLVLLSPYVTHRHPEFWPDGERFEPLRFEKARAAGRPRHAYLPFGTGPRVCIGASFALTEAVMILATLAQEFDLRPVDGHVLRLDPNVTLRPKTGLPMTVAIA